MEYKTRKDVPNQYKWDLSSRFKTDEDWEKTYQKLLPLVDNLKKYKGKVMSSSRQLNEVLKEYFKVDKIATKLYVYASLNKTTDLSDSKYKTMLDKISNFFTNLSYNTSFLEPEILEFDEETIEKFIAETPELNEYKIYLTNLMRSKKHILDEDKESIISLLTRTSGSFSSMNKILKDSAIDFGKVRNDDGEEIELTQSTYLKLLQSRNRDVRENAFNVMFEKLSQFSNIFSSLLIAEYENWDSISKVRKFDSSFDMARFDENIPIEVNDNLYKVVKKRLPVYQKYFDIIRRKLNLDKLYPYDVNAKLIDYSKEYSIEKAREMILSALSCYGDEYLETLRRAFDEKWIDFCTYKGKEAGAYSSGNYGDNPVVFLNYNYRLDDVSALAHELGHAMHTYFSDKNNNYIESSYEIFVAEVASLTNEVLLSNYILNNSNSKEEKAFSIYNLIDVIQNNLFSAALEGEFENILHKKVNEGETLSLDDLNNTIYNLKKEYYGDKVELVDYSKYSWIRRAHYFRPFYLYKYAVGVSCACYTARKILSGDKEFLNKYLNFLKSGKTKDPIDLLKDAGIDVTSEEVFNDAIDYFDELLDQFEELTK